MPLIQYAGMSYNFMTVVEDQSQAEVRQRLEKSSEEWRSSWNREQSWNVEVNTVECENMEVNATQ